MPFLLRRLLPTTTVFLFLFCARRVASFSPAGKPHRNTAVKSLVVLNKIPLPSDGGKSESNDLLERAARLRKEIEELESKATTPRPRAETPKVSEKAIEYSSIDDSVWLLSYRFSDQPEPSDDEKATDDTIQQPRRFYRGKVVLKFLSDGYTEIIEKQSLGSESEKADIVKAWGWDIEESDEADGQEYLLFSMDVDFELDGERTRQRFYFQARQDKDTRSQAISLSEGTVTVKKDVVQKSARWGFFSPAGILAQFRYVGDFIAKPTSANASN